MKKKTLEVNLPPADVLDNAQVFYCRSLNKLVRASTNLVLICYPFEERVTAFYRRILETIYISSE